jgi:sialate O-acetylesterase
MKFMKTTGGKSDTAHGPRARQFCLAISALACVLACGSRSWADPSVSTLFSDHMVLQQGHEIRIWGTADPAEAISVTLAGHHASATADARERWSASLPAMSAGGPFTLIIHGKKELVIRDVMIGEVWIASGQSNMTFSLGGTEHADTEIPKADYPQVRLFRVPRKIALSPQDTTLPAHWQICTPDTAKEFSAVAYFFARKIHRQLHVPVGVIESAWPGTTLQEWIAPEVLEADPDLKSLVDAWSHATSAEKTFADDSLPFELEFDDFELIPATDGSNPTTLADFDDGIATTSTGGSFSYSWNETSDSTFDLASPGHGSKGFAARVSGRLNGAQDAILAADYHLDRTPADLTQYAGLRFWVRGSGSFRFRSRQPTITDYDDYGMPVMKATEDWQPVTILFRDLRQDGWGVVEPLTMDALTGFSIECLTPLGEADLPVSVLYEGMITPLIGYNFRGVLWYQGESNALKAHQYRKLLPALISNWRAAFQEQDLDFLIVQLPNHGAIPQQPTDSAWAELREAQLLTVKHVPDTGLAVTIDVGDPKDLHPHRKLEVGERLALWALGTTYKQPIEYSGPLYESLAISGNTARVRFSHAAGLEVRGSDELQGFEIAGADRKFHWATAHIDGDIVTVSSPDVANPVAVRYAWADSPICNLFNKAGLPASPFRTDDWPGITGQ